jgi:hypothetical protein
MYENGMKVIPLAELVDRRIYRITSRNLVVGVWHAERSGFMGIRSKFNEEYLFTEYHWETGGRYGTAHALEDTGESIPDDIRFKESLPTIDSINGRLVEFTTPVAEGGNGWVYNDTQQPIVGTPISHTNKELFDILYPYHQKFLAERIAENKALWNNLGT